MSYKEIKKTSHIKYNSAGSKKKSFWAWINEDKAKLFFIQQISVFIIAFAVFSNSIPNGFNIDDGYYTTKDNTIANMGLRAIPMIFTTNTFNDDVNSAYEYRPVAMLSFALQHQFLDARPATGHFINVLIYSIFCVLVFVLLYRWFGMSKDWFALFIALIYTVHPLHTEVVDNIKNRDELLANLFGFMTLASLWKWHQTAKIRHAVSGIFVFILALLCKKTALTYVALVPMAFYFFSDMPVRKIALLVVVLFTVLIIMLLAQDHFLPNQQRVYLFIENPFWVGKYPLGVKTATISYILGWYFYLHIIPYPLSFYYGYKHVALFNWSDLLPVLSIVVHLVLLGFIIANFRRKKIFAFGGLFYLVCILPFANTIEPIAGIMGERFTFASSLGYCILLVSSVFYLFGINTDNFSLTKKSNYLLVTCFLIFISYAAMSIARNTKWESEWILYSNDIKHLQSSAKANILYSELVVEKTNYYRQQISKSSGPEKERYKDSLLMYEPDETQPLLRVLAVEPDLNKILNNLAVIYTRHDSFDLAKKYLLQERQFMGNNPPNEALHYNLGWVYENLSEKQKKSSFLDSAINEYKTVLNINRNYSPAYWRLSHVYLNQHDTISALSILSEGIKIDSDIVTFYLELGNIYIYRKDTATAISWYEKGAETTNPDVAVFDYLQKYYGDRNNLQKERYYRNKKKHWETTRTINDK